MARKTLTEEEQEWLNANEDYVNQDYVGLSELLIGPLSECASLDVVRNVSLVDRLTHCNMNSSVIDRYSFLTPMEKRVLILKYCDHLSERQIAAMITTSVYVGDSLIKSTTATYGMVQGVLKRAKEKIQKKLLTPLVSGVE